MATTPPVPADLSEAVMEALERLTGATNLDADALFADRVVDDFGTLPAPAAHAAGVIEGAALALGLTALELLDQVEAPIGAPLRRRDRRRI